MDKDQHAGVVFASQDKGIQNALDACSFKELCEAERSSGAEVASILFPILGWKSGGIGAAADEVSKLLSAARGEAAFHSERAIYWEKVAKDRSGEAEGPHVARMENDLLAIAETVQPRAGQDSMDYAMIVSCVRRIFEADEEFYINLHAKVRGRSEEQDMSTTYIGFGNDTLAKMPTVSDGEQIICPYCQGVHKLESATTEEGKTNILMFFKCGDKSYIGAVAGRLIAGIKPDVSGKV